MCVDWQNPTWQQRVLSELRRQRNSMVTFSRVEAVRNNTLIDEESPMSCCHQQKSEEDLTPSGLSGRKPKMVDSALLYNTLIYVSDCNSGKTLGKIVSVCSVLLKAHFRHFMFLVFISRCSWSSP